MTTLILSIPEIHCPSCEKLIKASLQDQKRIKSVSVDLEKKEIELEYNETKTNKKEIIKLITEGTGYSVNEN